VDYIAFFAIVIWDKKLSDESVKVYGLAISISGGERDVLVASNAFCIEGLLDTDAFFDPDDIPKV
jgi:hypothetical protein